MDPPKIGIIGAGFAGMCAAIQIQKQLNIDNFTVFDENGDVGGTWLVNTYPGCACDVASHMYSYSFEQNPYWSKAYSGQEEIWQYQRSVARKYDLYSKIKFYHKVLEAKYDEKILKWNVTVLDMKTKKETTHVFDLFISAVGGLRAPNWPKEFEPFAKPKTHSAQWDSSIKLKDKVVAIVGSGASAVQIIPAIVDDCKRLIVYQRQPAWVVPRIQCNFPSYMQWAFAYVPGVQWALRNLIFWSAEMMHPAFRVDHWLGRIADKRGRWQLARQIEDPVLREKLTPDYQFGCKRITPSNDYYPALAKQNVTVIRSKIAQVTKDTIKNEDGTVEKPDVLILATGFKVQDYFSPLKITAKKGQNMLEKWKKEGPSAYAGIVTNDMPNAFFLLGPNTALGHNSVVFSIECQVNWMIKVIEEMMERKAKTVEVKKSVEDAYMDRILGEFEKTVWGTVDCGSWYVDHRGVNTTLWPESLVSYHNLTKSVDFSMFNFS